MNRRQFLATTLATGVAAVPLLAMGEDSPASRPALKKAMKYDLVGFAASIDEKFDAIKAAGFIGCEINSPTNVDRDLALAASNRTGIKIHGVIDSVHWKDCLSDPDPAVRARGLEALKKALNDAHFYRATTVLLVPGRVTDKITFDEVWSRSAEQIHQAIPMAQQLGVKIAIEVVWNKFITKPEQFVKYIDQFNTPAVGGYFDCSNMIKFGAPNSEWIQALGPRLLKFDFKGYSIKNGWVKIGEGDENWPDVLKALETIGYHGWATAEVHAKDMDELNDIYARMTRVLG